MPNFYVFRLFMPSFTTFEGKKFVSLWIKDQVRLIFRSLLQNKDKIRRICRLIKEKILRKGDPCLAYKTTKLLNRKTWQSLLLRKDKGKI